MCKFMCKSVCGGAGPRSSCEDNNVLCGAGRRCLGRESDAAMGSQPRNWPKLIRNNEATETFVAAEIGNSAAHSDG